MIFLFPDGEMIYDDEYESWMGDDYIEFSEDDLIIIY